MIGKIMEFFITHIFQREYPMVGIERGKLRSDSVPHMHSFPYSIHLGFSFIELEAFKLRDNILPDAVAEILTHEYLHIVLDKIGERQATFALNEVNRYSVKHICMVWMLKDENQRVIWETVNGERTEERL